MSPVCDVPYEVIDHTADWALRVYGHNFKELLLNAASGMNSLLVDHLSDIPNETTRKIVLDADDREGLLVAWLSELAYFAESEQIVFVEADLFEVNSTGLRGVVRGGRAGDLQKHIKAVTYHNLEILEYESGLQATIVFDV